MSKGLIGVKLNLNNLFNVTSLHELNIFLVFANYRNAFRKTLEIKKIVINMLKLYLIYFFTLEVS